MLLQFSFLFYYPDIWDKLAQVYEAFRSDSRFEVSVVLCPILDRGEAFAAETRAASIAFLKENGILYHDILQPDGTYEDIRRTLRPQILFRSKPYDDETTPLLNAIGLWRTLCCLCPYAFSVSSGPFGGSQPYVALSWISFRESQWHLNRSRQYSRLKHRSNGFVSGYTGLDSFLFPTDTPDASPWKCTEPGVKRIIWAPHHLKPQCFADLAEPMLRLAEQYKGKLEIVMKPHPLMKVRLQQLEGWDEARAEALFRRWSEGENTSVVNGAYRDLFLTSDAMIHNCGSFRFEYLCTGKPVLAVDSPEDELDKPNDFTRSALNQHYHGATPEEIGDFIRSVVLEGNDPMADARSTFVRENLLAENGRPAWENVYGEVCRRLFPKG